MRRRGLAVELRGLGAVPLHRSRLCLHPVWLLNYNTTCPAGWWTSANDCYRNSSGSTSVPGLTPAQLADTVLTATAGSSDTAALAVDGELYTLSQSSVVGLDEGWTSAEFNLFGNYDRTQAVLNSDASLTVQILTDTVVLGTSGPTCAKNGFTGETNNLNLLGAGCPSAAPCLGFNSSRATSRARPLPRAERSLPPRSASTPRSRAARTTSASSSATTATKPIPRGTSGGNDPVLLRARLRGGRPGEPAGRLHVHPPGREPVHHHQRLRRHRSVPHLQRQRRRNLSLAPRLGGRVGPALLRVRPRRSSFRTSRPSGSSCPRAISTRS